MSFLSRNTEWTWAKESWETAKQAQNPFVNLISVPLDRLLQDAGFGTVSVFVDGTAVKRELDIPLGPCTIVTPFLCRHESYSRRVRQFHPARINHV